MNEKTQTDSVKRIGLSVHNIEATTKWYLSSFSCKLLWQTPTKALIAFDNIEVLLLLPSQGLPHLSFEKENADTFGQLYEQDDQTLACSISDPSGNIVQLVKK